MSEYVERFFEEKDLSEEIYEIEHNGTVHFMESEAVIELIKSAPESEKVAISSVLRQIDFRNGDVHHYLKFLAQKFVETHY